MLAMLKKEKNITGKPENDRKNSGNKDSRKDISAGREEEFANFALAVRANLEAFIC